MLESIISSKIKVKLLLKFFLNPNACSYLRALEEDFHVSSNAIRVELNRMEKAGLLVSENMANKKIYRANKNHPLFNDIHNIILKYVGLDQVIEKVIQKIGDVRKVYLLGDFARGKDADIIDLLIVTSGLDKNYLLHLIDKAEKLINRKIRYLLMDQQESIRFFQKQNPSDYLLIFENEG